MMQNLANAKLIDTFSNVELDSVDSHLYNVPALKAIKFIKIALQEL